MVGGVLGGLIGGLCFDPINAIFSSPDGRATLSRCVGFVVIGFSVGLFVGLVEGWTKTAWLLMRAGPLAGKQFVLHRDTTVLGSSPKAEIYLFKDDAIEPRHALLHNRGGRFEIEDCKTPDGTYVNGVPDHSPNAQERRQDRAGKDRAGVRLKNRSETGQCDYFLGDDHAFQDEVSRMCEDSRRSRLGGGQAGEVPCLCAHVAGSRPDRRASRPPRHKPTAFGAKCPGCGKAIQVPDSMAGQAGEMPHLRARLANPPAGCRRRAGPGNARHGAAAGFDSGGEEERVVRQHDGRRISDRGGAEYLRRNSLAGATPAASAEPPRRPCPRCGEMIPIGAAKCRFCDAIFDEKLRRKKKRREVGSSLPTTTK